MGNIFEVFKIKMNRLQIPKNNMEPLKSRGRFGWCLAGMCIVTNYLNLCMEKALKNVRVVS